MHIIVLLLVIIIIGTVPGHQANTSQDLHHCSYCEGLCSACQPGYYGQHCAKQCRVCDRDEMCDHQNGNCVKRDNSMNISSIWAYNCALCSGQCKSCDSGWYGKNCTERCINCGLNGCNRKTGICFECKSYYCGTNCTETCPTTCSRRRKKRSVCHRDTRQCLDGCQKGMWGDRCDIPCSEGCLNRDCYFDGTCHCRPGYTGSECIAQRVDEKLPAADSRSITSATENYNGLNTHQDGVSKLRFVVLLGITVISSLIAITLSFLLWRTHRWKYGRDRNLMLQLADIKDDTFHSKETECFVQVKPDQEPIPTHVCGSGTKPSGKAFA